MKQYDTISVNTVLALKAGDEQAFKTVYECFAGRLYGNLLKFVKSEETAKDLLQEVFLKIWEKRVQIDPTKSFSSYLFQIAENLAYDFFRKAARDKKLQIQLVAHATEAYTHIEEMLITKEYNDLLQEAIDALPPRRRQIFRLCKMDGKSYEEVARQLKLSTSTISDHIVKGTLFIRKYCYTHYEMVVIICLIFLFTGI